MLKRIRLGNLPGEDPKQIPSRMPSFKGLLFDALDNLYISRQE
jgi:hypothetical protein